MRNEALQFGRFVLKSGRASPYFFNSGQFNDGAALAQLGRHYMRAVARAGLQFDMLFGPAYKGITLAAACAIACARAGDGAGRAVPYCFNRKEEKDHGDGGLLVGAPLRGRVLIVDDVISAGAALQFSIDLVRNRQATPAGMVIALDRQERGADGQVVSAALQRRFDIPIIPVVTRDDLVEFLQGLPDQAAALKTIQEHHAAAGDAG